MTNCSEDKIAIQELSAIYANAMDNNDLATWVSTWHKDGVWEGGAGRFEGTAGLAGLLSALGDRIKKKRHIMSNFVIEVEGDFAKQTCYLIIIDLTKQSLPGTAVYLDTLRKENGRWCFLTRKVTLDT